MSYIAPKVVQEVKQMDLLTYLENYESYELVHFSGNTYTTKTHEVLKSRMVSGCGGGKVSTCLSDKSQGLYLFRCSRKDCRTGGDTVACFHAGQKDGREKVIAAPAKPHSYTERILLTGTWDWYGLYRGRKWK